MATTNLDGGDDQLSLAEMYDRALKLAGELEGLPGKDPKYKDILKSALGHLDTADRMVEQLKVFSDNEHFSEHSTASLKYILIPARRADLQSKFYPDYDDPERDDKRLEALEMSMGFYKEFLRGCVTLQLESEEKIKPHLSDAHAQRRPDRDSKVAQMRAQMELDKQLAELDKKLAAAKLTGAPLDEDLLREHTLTTIQTWAAKSITQLGLLQSEGSMLKQMMAHRATNPGKSAAPPKPQREGPIEPPMVITKDMVKNMTATGQSINRKDFQLVTRGYGPIGAPTMTLDELAQKEMAQMAKPTETVVEEFDEDNMDKADEETYKLRERDEVTDYIRRGDGNKYNMG